MGLSGIDVVFKLATVDELDDVSKLNQPIWIRLIPSGFPGIIHTINILDAGRIMCTATFFIIQLATLRPSLGH